MDPASGKSFLSNIEKGKREIGALTVGKLIKALDLSESWIDKFLEAEVTPDAEETKLDLAADRLMRLAEQDPTAPPATEPLLLLLAEEWAQKSFTDPQTAYTALRGALQAGADLKAQGSLPSNASDQLQAILRRVSELNDAGQLEDADAALAAASERNSAEAEALFSAHLKQDRLRNRPDAAAQRLIARLRGAAPPGGVFNATRGLLHEWREEGERLGDPFRLHVARALALANHHDKGPRRALSLADLAGCQLALGQRDADPKYLRAAEKNFAIARDLCAKQKDWQNWAAVQNSLGIALRNLGQREGDTARLDQAIAAFQAALPIYTPKAAPMDWAMTQNNLGTALNELGKRECDTARLHQAVAAYQAALTIHTPEAAPMKWAKTQNNLGIALRWLGTLGGGVEHFDAAQAVYDACLTIHTRDANSFDWAKTQWNLADLALARHALVPDPAHLDTARRHLALARQVFAEDEDTHQLAECDRLLAKIDAA